MILIALAITGPARAATLNGVLSVAGPAASSLVQQVRVTLFEATEFTPVALASTVTDEAGHFELSTNRETSNSILFLSAALGGRVRFITILGDHLPEAATINEVTSVAASYAMAQFFRTGRIAGDAFRLRIAAMMSRNIADPATGELSEVLRSSPNADQTNAMRLTHSLANLLNQCIQIEGIKEAVLLSTRNELRKIPVDTAEALANLARNPAENAHLIALFALTGTAFAPALTTEPDQWTIAVKLNDTGRPDVPFGGAANVAWDSRGYAWVANNVTQGTPNSTKFNVVLRPDGHPADGTNGEPVSPFNTGGLLGVGWGVTVDRNDHVWFGNFGWGSPKDLYYPSQTPSSASGAGTGSGVRPRQDVISRSML
ncbi:hypothetical protein CKO36_13445 [Rhabdochromatium marinum]|nr:hypothetical protein [Rhabdochromatium marinum]